MKNKSLKIRISERRLSKLQNYAAQADKTMTQVVEELIDTLPNLKNGEAVRVLDATCFMPGNPEVLFALGVGEAIGVSLRSDFSLSTAVAPLPVESKLPPT